jgi:hypothetical protein
VLHETVGDAGPVLAALTPAPDTGNLQQLHAWLRAWPQRTDLLPQAQTQAIPCGRIAGAAMPRRAGRTGALMPWAALPTNIRHQHDAHADAARTGRPGAYRPPHRHRPGASERERQQQLAQLCEQGSTAHERMRALADLAQRCGAFAQMEYGFLYNPTTNLLAIGYNVSERRLDASYYDLLASEVRLASFVAIAQGQLPQEHWFALGRQLCIVAGKPVLLSWSGSMFEYLMPLLVMPNYPARCWTRPTSR